MQQEKESLLVSPQKTLQNLKVYLKLFKDTDPHYNLRIEEDSLIFSSEHQTKELGISDMIGLKKQLIADDIFKITFNSFPLRKNWLGKMHRVIEHLALYTAADQHTIQSLEEIVLSKITRRPCPDINQLRFLAYFNPAAGSNSNSHLQRVQTFLAQSNFQLDIVPTQYKNFCKEHAETVDPTRYHGVLIISGDGLMHEFVNSSLCGKIPVSHVPAGSANAFSKTQTAAAHEACQTQTAVFLAIKGRTRSFNLWKVELQRLPDPVYSFLSVEWAFLADIDINSEFLRCLGGLRFQVYSVWRCLAMRRYPGKISYCYEDKPLPAIHAPITDPAFHTIEDDFLSTIFSTISFISDKYEVAPLLAPEDKAIDMQLVTNGHGRWNLVKYLLNLETGAHFDRLTGELKEGAHLSWAKVKSYRVEPKGAGYSRGVFGIDGESYQSQRLQVSCAQRELLTFA